MYKTLLQGGHFSKDTHSVSRASSFSPAAFASAFLKIVGKDVTVPLAHSNGAFVVAELCERILEEGTEEEKNCLRGWFEKSVVLETIEASRPKGTKVLLDALEKLHGSDV
jgi:pumilio family protein 6